MRYLQFFATIAFVLIALCAHPSIARSDDLESRLIAAASRVLPAVVAVGPADLPSRSHGAGFFIDYSSGFIISSFHVIRKLSEIKVRLSNSDAWLPVQLVDFDPQLDLALLRLKSPAPVPIGKAPEFGSTTTLKPGQFVVAFGSPGGLSHSVSFGVISALDRLLEGMPESGRYIQVDAVLSSGSSGGPISNLDGKIVGLINRGGANGAAAFAVPASSIQEFIEKALARASSEDTVRGFVGFELQFLDEAFRRTFGSPANYGVIVSAVWPGSAAAAADLRVGDTILSVGALSGKLKDEGELENLKSYILRLGPSQQTVRFFRDGAERTVNINLAEKPPCEDDDAPVGSPFLVRVRTSSCIAPILSDSFLVTRDPKSIHSELEVGDFIFRRIENGEPREPVSAQLEFAEMSGVYQVVRNGRVILLRLETK